METLSPISLSNGISFDWVDTFYKDDEVICSLSTQKWYTENKQDRDICTAFVLGMNNKTVNVVAG